MNTDQKTKVLVVEDDTLFLWSLGQFLRRGAYDVSLAKTAELALDMAKKQPFDVVISDYHLPGLNGKELIRKLRDLYPVIKTVLVSAYQKEETGADSECLVDAFMNKPIELQNLDYLLQELTAKVPFVEVQHP